RAEDVRDVPVLRERSAERLEDLDLLGRVRDVILAANDVGDPVQPVLERRGEVVRRPPVAPDEHEVLDLVVRVVDPTADQVLPPRRPLVGHADADRSLVLVRTALVEEALRLFATPVHAVELEGELAVPVESEPAERLLDLLGRLGGLPARVRVLDAQAALSPL